VIRAALVGLAVCLFAAPAAAQTFDCPTLYEKGEYGAAAECFEALARQGNGNGHLFYNLGNARYREGSLGEAITAWRRAELFLPRDGDLRANLKRGREQAKDDLAPPGERAALGRTLMGPYDALAGSELLLLGAVAWTLLLLLAAVRLSRPIPGGGAVAALLGLIVVLGLGGSSLRSYTISRHPVAVVLAEEVTLRSGRDVLSTDLAKLHEGAEVTVVEVSEGWVQVALSTGLRGWLSRGSVGLVQW